MGAATLTFCGGWKTAGPYSRLARNGAGEGIGRGGRVEGHLRRSKVVGEAITSELVLGEGEEDVYVRVPAATEVVVEVDEEEEGGGWEALVAEVLNVA